MDLSILPREIQHNILRYLECPIAKIIKNEINTYKTDHNSLHTRTYQFYYVKDFFSFYEYYFDKKFDPVDYNSFCGYNEGGDIDDDTECYCDYDW